MIRTEPKIASAKQMRRDFDIQIIPVHDIFVVGARRPIDDGAVASLMESIKQIGLQTPITIRYDGDIPDPDTGEIIGGYALVAGAHRLEACRRLGMSLIPAVIRDCNAINAELWEIDENLIRAELSPTERARQTARRKAIAS